MKNFLLNLTLLMTSFCVGLNGQDINVTVNDASGEFAPDGSIKAVVSPSYGAAPYTFVWEAEEVLPPTVNVPIGDPETTNGEHEITELLPGRYCVTITSSEGCNAEDCFDVEVCQNNCLKADFTYEYDFDDGCAIHFSETSAGSPSGYYWDFGDGGIAFEPAPTHIFEESGCYDVKLTVDANGEESSTTQEVCVYSCNNEGGMYAIIDGPLIASANTGNYEYKVEVFGGTPPYTFQWNWGEAVALSGNGDGPYNINFESQGTHNFSVYIEDANNEDFTAYLTVDVAEVVLELESSVAIVNRSTKLWALYNLEALQSWPDETWDWNFGDGNEETGFSDDISHTYSQAGNVTATLTLNDGDNSYIATKQIEVFNSFNAAYGNPSSEYCLFSGARLSNESDWTYYTGFCACDESLHSYSPVVVNTNTINEVLFNIRAFANLACEDTSPKVCDPPFPNGRCMNGYFTLTNQETGKVIRKQGNDPVEDYKVWYNSPTYQYTEALEDWGCWNLRANTENPSGNIVDQEWECVAYVEPSELVFTAIETDVCGDSDCDEVVLRPVIEGGGFHREDISPNGCPSCYGNDMKVYESYDWKLYSINSDDLTDEGILDFIGDGNCAKVDLNHPYFDNFIGASEVRFSVVITVTDFLGHSVTYGEEVTVPVPKVDLVLPEENKIGDEYVFTFCPQDEIYLFDELPIVGTLPSNANIFIPPLNCGDCIEWDATTKNIKINPNKILDELGGTLIVKLSHTTGFFFNECVHFNEDIRIEVDPINALPGDPIEACIGPSLQTIGNGGLSAEGGSGEYTYSWSPTFGLNDPTIANPMVFFPDAGQETYTLTVTDAQNSDCTASASVVVTASSSNPTVEIDPTEIKICHGTEYDLGATVTTGGDHNGTLAYHWSSNHAVLPIDPNGQDMVFSEEITSKDPGLYEFTLKLEDVQNGCYDEAIVDVEILPKWRYQGYESNVAFTTGFGLNGDFWEGGPSDNILYLNGDPTVVSGAELPITHEWLENLSPNYVDVDLNAVDVPINGSFLVSKETPYLTIRMTDDNGCTKDFRTNRHLLLDSPELSIDLIGQSNPVVCEGNDICFLVKLETNFKGWNEWLLPQHIELDYSIDHLTSGGPGNAESGIIELSLADPDDGVYFTQICQNDATPPPGPELYHTTLTVSGSIGPSPFLEVEEKYQYYISNETPATPQKDICLDKIIDKAIQLSINPNNCAGDLVLNPMPSWPPNWNHSKYVWKGGVEGFVHIDGYTTSEGGYVSFLHAFIDQCMEEDEFAPDNEIEERTSDEPNSELTELPVANALKITPNPFSGGVLISYSILSESDAVPVSIRILDEMGKVIHTVVTGKLHESGDYSYSYNGNGLLPGVYFVEMVVDKERVLEKIVKIK